MDDTPSMHPMEGPRTNSFERTYAMCIHLMWLAGHVIPVAPFVPALILWLIKRDQSPFIDDHGKEALNFQISIFLYILIGALTFVCGGFVIIGVAYVLAIVGMVMAAVAAHGGRYYRYPMCIRMIR